MADIDIRRAHHLGRADAREAADRMADKLGRKFGLKGDWDGDVLRFERPGVAGTLTVGPKDVRLSVALGFLLKAMKGSIEQAIQHELDALFAGKTAAKTRTAAAPTKKKAAGPRKKGG
ncbi:MAG: polyhydroxyalkanoic acid system family protein [Burkholderiales bacterium]|nr:polyhydroxyalkanoic acid system family protein [Burkholderiales bacterium]